MRKLAFASMAAALLMGGAAMAASATLTIEPSHRAVIKQFVVKRHLHPLRMKENIALGVALPASVEIQPVPQELYADVPEIQNYEYFYWDGKVVLVDPETRSVVQIIE